MIRINLLGLKKEVKKAAGPAVSLEGAKLTAMVLGFAGAALLALAFHYYSLQNQETTYTNQMRDAEKEKSRLASVKAEFERFQASKADLTRRIDIIEALKRGQTGPVEMLTQLATAVQANKTMWVFSFDSTGDKMLIDGVAINVNIVADFLHSLRTIGFFKNVEIKEAYQDEQAVDLANFIFRLTADIEKPQVLAPAPAGAKPKA